ncbi:hypothetical protein ACQKJG_18500 [Priestia megaterium]|uniref:hypothetical protein n=1 Tax=Priestia megaterium TaxID=1404 RepID=UPI003D059430
MKKRNALYTTVVITKQEIVSATHFDYKEAKEDLINSLSVSFDQMNDEGLIFEVTGEGPSKPLFNIRSLYSGDPEEEREPAKEHPNLRFFFKCEHCDGTEGKMLVDDDNDIIVRCRSCKKPTYIQGG